MVLSYATILECYCCASGVGCPILAGLSGKGVKPLTWASCIVALVGVGLLEQGGAPPGVGDVWNLLSALFFGLQVIELKVLTADYTSS